MKGVVFKRGNSFWVASLGIGGKSYYIPDHYQSKVKEGQEVEFTYYLHKAGEAMCGFIIIKNIK